MQTLIELRKVLKPIGFNVKSKNGYATYIHINTKQELNFNVFTPELLSTWQPLFTWLREHREILQELRNNTGLIGLIKL